MTLRAGVLHTRHPRGRTIFCCFVRFDPVWVLFASLLLLAALALPARAGL